MGMFESVKQTLVELPISDIQRARLELAMDESASLQRKVSDLQTDLGRVQAQLLIVTSERDSALKRLAEIEKEHSEEIRIFHGIEFRKGKRTNGRWIAFCPNCKNPVTESGDQQIAHCTADCKWMMPLRNGVLSHLAHKLAKEE